MIINSLSVTIAAPERCGRRLVRRISAPCGIHRSDFWLHLILLYRCTVCALSSFRQGIAIGVSHGSGRSQATH